MIMVTGIAWRRSSGPGIDGPLPPAPGARVWILEGDLYRGRHQAALKACLRYPDTYNVANVALRPKVPCQVLVLLMRAHWISNPVPRTCSQGTAARDRDGNLALPVRILIPMSR